MGWYYATSVSVTNGATVVSVNAGDDILLIQPGDGLIIGTQPPVEVKRTYLDGLGNKKIELFKAWPYGSQTNQAAEAYPTAGDFQAATAVLKQLIDGFTLASQADAEGGTENSRPMTAYRVKQAIDKLLGSASKLPATTTAGDHTAGRATRVGDFGNGFMMDMRAGQSVPFSNYDTPSKCWGKGTIRGFIDGAALGIPGFSSTAYGVVEIHGQYSDASGGSGVHQRFYYEGLTISRVQRGASSWSNWNVVGAPILGAVGFGAGLSIGSNFEYGLNPSGNYLKFADGTMICWGTPLVTATSLSNSNVGNYGWSYYYDSNTVVYPAEFVSAASVQVTPQGSFISALVTFSGVTGFAVSPITNTVTSTGAPIMYTAVGRWR